jgi:hypothetical protein
LEASFWKKNLPKRRIGFQKEEITFQKEEIVDLIEKNQFFQKEEKSSKKKK